MRAQKLGIMVVLLGLGAVAVALVVRDPERRRVESAFFAYLGDLRMRRFDSASRRVFPDDLTRLKMSALEHASEYVVFRDSVMAFMGVSAPQDLAAVPRERFYEFLLDRTFAEHPEVHEVISQGSVVGTRIIRDGGSATVDATFGVGTRQGRRQFVMHVDLVRLDDEWMVRL